MVKFSTESRAASIFFVMALSACSEDTTDLDPVDRTGSPVNTAPLAHSAADASAPATTQDATIAPPPVKQDAAADAAVTPIDDDQGDDHGGDDHGDDAGSGDQGEHDAGGDAQDADVGPPVIPADGTLASVYAVVSLSCVSCHGAGKPLDFSSADAAYATLVNVPAAMKACAATDGGTPWLRVVPGDLDNSLMVQKIEGHAPCGNQMPIKTLLSDAYADVLRAWVSAGAPQQ